MWFKRLYFVECAFIVSVSVQRLTLLTVIKDPLSNLAAITKEDVRVAPRCRILKNLH